MDRIPPGNEGAAGAEDSAIRQTSSPSSSPAPRRNPFRKTADSRVQDAQVAASILLANADGARGGDATSLTASTGRGARGTGPQAVLARLRHVLMTFGKFVGPGFMVSVAYSKSRMIWNTRDGLPG